MKQWREPAQAHSVHNGRARTQTQAILFQSLSSWPQVKEDDLFILVISNSLTKNVGTWQRNRIVSEQVLFGRWLVHVT